MHRDRLRNLIETKQLKYFDGAHELMRGARAILLQLDAAEAFLNEQTEENSVKLRQLLNAR